MEKDGYVSLWIGNTKSDELLAEYVELIYNDDGEWVASQFLKDFNIDIDDFDEDFIERIYSDDAVNSIAELIAGCSYNDIVIQKYDKIVFGSFSTKANTGILLYNFQYDGNTRSINNKDYDFKFIGSVGYVEQ
ncbi:hypothetical protein E4V42_22570 [Clostridium estertheticum]|uniref:Immunity protein 22 n=1 Tax=Clostridium estertheticum TaxID=238834 RepID=A0A5N7IV45_9CLOT|nr:immunity 22 family protein [Clostridium estertheticum]MPQ34173.1 hypothetical protein [Clostridium estertheticum]MPQ64905.1 hypothetical protein [Clostridium estertheticum]